MVLHLSDFHLHSKNNAATAKFPFIARAVQNEEPELSGVVIVVSGDVA